MHIHHILDQHETVFPANGFLVAVIRIVWVVHNDRACRAGVVQVEIVECVG